MAVVQLIPHNIFSTAPPPPPHIYNINSTLHPYIANKINPPPANISNSLSQYNFTPPPQKKTITSLSPPLEKNIKDMAVAVVQLTPHNIFSTVPPPPPKEKYIYIYTMAAKSIRTPFL